MKAVPLFVRISPTLRLTLKLRAVKEGVPLQKLVERLLRLGLKHAGKVPDHAVSSTT